MRLSVESRVHTEAAGGVFKGEETERGDMQAPDAGRGPVLSRLQQCQSVRL